MRGSGISYSKIFQLAILILTNTYVSGVLCSLLAVCIIYIIQVRYSKRMLKKDFRCNEVMEEIYIAINCCSKIIDDFSKNIIKEEENSINKKGNVHTEMIGFYERNKIEIKEITLLFSNENNSLLIESVQSCFFINLNFKLLNIVNNIKNRLPNLKNGYSRIEELYKKYKFDEVQYSQFKDNLHIYIKDLQFMSLYWKHLLDYLEYDEEYTKLLIETFNLELNNLDVLKESTQIINSKNRKIDKILKRKHRKIR